LPDSENARATAVAIGRITCIKTCAEIGLLYQWDNGETQAALYDGCQPETPSRPDHPAEPKTGENRS